MPALFEPMIFADGTQLPRILPGPMEGVTAGAWLKILTRHRWVQAWWTPFLRISTGVPRRSRLAAWLAPYLATGLPVIAQIMGENTARLAETARRLHELGAAAIDLNCACPSPVVVRNHSGGERLRHPAWIAETLQAMKQAVGDAPLGVKLRIGYESPEEFASCIAPAVCEARPDFVTVHFRTVQERYEPIADGLERLTTARQALSGLVVIGSGDLFTPQDAIAMHERCGVDAVAPARGMLTNPRLLADLAQVLRGEAPTPFTIQEKAALLGEFVVYSPRHFQLQMAANLYGKNSPEFNAFLKK
ncbi:MAG: tRNA-dihydrouridine synthase family protein [Victivallales bacterium]|nr:tRNA-dihydrouridine synthase family protein [Victivallales bacterium]